ncbi:MAG: Y-family DNA polymerase [Rhodanobacter sp.]
MLWLALQFPALALESVPASLAGPRVVADRFVRLADAEATRAGVRIGSTLASARALLPTLVVIAPTDGRHTIALEDLAPRLGASTSVVSIDSDGPALLGEIGASTRLFGGVAETIRHVLDAFADTGITVAWAVAPTPGAALILATERPHMVVTEPGGVADALSPLPVQCLPLADKLIAQLVRVGVHRIGEILQLPRAGLARRLGVASVQTLDKLLGGTPDLRARWTAPEHFERRMEWPDAVEQLEAISFPLRRLVGDMASYLSMRAQRGTVWRLVLEHERIASSNIDIASAAGGADAAHLYATSYERLASTGLPAPVVAMRLHLVATRESPRESDSLFSDSTAGERAAALIDRLQARLGTDAVYGLQGTADARPEMSQRPVPAGQAMPATLRARCRPSWLLAVPQPLGPTPTELSMIAGPERIESGWWDGDDARRDYFLAQNAHGQTLWIYRDVRAGGWFVHGMFG